MTGNRVLPRRQCTGAAEPVEQLVRSHEHRRPAQPVLERAVEKRVGPAMHEGDDRLAPRTDTALGLGGEPGLPGKV